MPAQHKGARQVSAAQSELVTVEGTVKTITMENKASGYLVAKIKVKLQDQLSSTQGELLGKKATRK